MKHVFPYLGGAIAGFLVAFFFTRGDARSNVENGFFSPGVMYEAGYIRGYVDSRIDLVQADPGDAAKLQRIDANVAVDQKEMERRAVKYGVKIEIQRIREDQRQQLRKMTGPSTNTD